MADLDLAVDAYLGEQKDQAVNGLKLSVSNALAINPDQEAQARKAASTLNIPVDTARDNLAEAQQRAFMQQTDFGMLSERFPKTAGFMGQQENANIAHDDLDNLSGIESAFGELKKLGRAGVSGLRSASGGVVGIVRAPFELAAPLVDPLVGRILPNNPLRQTAAGLARYQEGIAQTAAAEMPRGDSILSQGVYSGVGSLSRNLASLPLIFLPGGQQAALTGMVAPVFGEEYGKARAEGINPAQATVYGASQAAIEYATEKIPLSWLMKDLKAGSSFAKTLATQVAKEVPSEQVATVFQDLNEWAVLNPEKPFTDYLAERPSAAAQTLIATAVGAGGQVTVVKGIENALNVFTSKEEKARLAEEHGRFLDNLTNLTSASNVLRRDPATFETFVQAASEDAPVTDVYISAQVLNQDGLGETLAALSPSVAEQLPEALALGGDVRIPVEEYSAKIAPTQYAQSLTDYIKLDPNGMSRQEAQVYMQSDQAQEFQAEVERLLTEQTGDENFKASTQSVKDLIRTELDTANRFTGPVNDAYASLVSNRYAVFAAQLGTTPEALYARYPYKVRAESPSISPNRLYNQRKGIKDEYTLDLFGVPATGGTDQNTGGFATGSDTTDVPQVGADRGQYATRTELIAENVRTVGADRVNTTEDAAQALAYLGRGAVERFDALVTDKDGKPLAIVGSFKGALTQTAVYPATVVFEAFRVPGAANIWFAHNHPSGTAEFSTADHNLTEQLSDVFRGSQITPRGMFAIAGKSDLGGRKWVYRTAFEATSNYGSTTPPQTTVRVPAIERVYTDENKLGDPITSVDTAKKALTEMTDRKAAVVLTDTRNAPIGMFPLDGLDLTKLRNNGSMDTLYRALSVANPGAAFITTDGTFDDDNIRNLAALFNAVDVRPLDVIEFRSDGATISWSEVGRPVSNQDFRQDTRGFFDPATLTTTLLKNADLSTFLHETGHFFLEMQFDVTVQLQKDAEIFGRNAMKPGERQVLDDTDAILSWFGVASLDEWTALDFEEKRSYHEKFARGFEAYLFEGNAPSIELQSLFQRFRAWLLQVYKDLKALNVELTDEVRGVFDRMLASNDEIALAEQNRSMVPLFNMAQQGGLTKPEFAEYQALGISATNDAIQELQARGLRDMQWLANSRGREIRKLKKQSRERRDEVRVDARREIMSQPVYRAWQFLTGKITADDKLTPWTPPKSDPDRVSPDIDSMFVAIAKLGGINWESARVDLSVHKDAKIPMPAFGKPVLRRNGGMTVDDMANSLFDFGYLEAHDLREFEDKFYRELNGDTQYSIAYDYTMDQGPGRPGEGLNLAGMTAGRLDVGALALMYGDKMEIYQPLVNLKMTAKEGLHPDLVAEHFGFSSGDELVRALLAAERPNAAIDGLTDRFMLERYGDLASDEAIERAADAAIHNDARGRFVATEANALAKATGGRRVMADAAKAFAQQMIARLKVRNVRPSQYASAQARAAKASAAAMKNNDLPTAAAEKRNELVNHYAARAAYDAQDNLEKGLRYLAKFDGDIKGIDVDYADQIAALLERFDLRKGQSLKAIDKRTSLVQWLADQREQGFEPEIPPAIENEALRKSYKDMTVEEFNGLVDTVRQIEHLGRLKDKLLTAADQRAFEAVRTEITVSILENANGRVADARTPTTTLGRAAQQLKRFWASHIKAAIWARILDGDKDAGPMWEYLIRPANARADQEATMRAEATRQLTEILAPVFKLGRMGGKGDFFPTIGRTLNREARLAIALNMGNEGNTQRLLGGENWTMAQIKPVLDTLTAAEWQAVQAVWDHFESYRPQIAAKERRVYGKEPEWVVPRGLQVQTADGQTLNLRGGYYPIKYDPAASQQAEQHADAEGAKRQLQGAYTSATTRRSFTKTRVEEVKGRPLLYTLSGLYAGVNDVIHDLAWHEWLIDANRLLRSKQIDAAIRDHYGPETKQQFKSWVADVAEGEKGAANAGEAAAAWLRQGISAAGLGFNAMSAAMQVLGFNQSIVRVGASWVGRGITRYIASPKVVAREVNAKSEFMANRTRTRFRELNELRNKVQDETAFMSAVRTGTFFLMLRAQQMVDVPTWVGMYEKAIAAGHNEDRAIALADQAVIDAQGGGQLKDLSAIERGSPTLKLFTVFYTFMNTALNLGVATGMSPKSRAKKAADLLMLYSAPPVLGYFLKEALTPDAGGDDDDLEGLMRRLAAEQLSYLMGLMVFVREFSSLAKVITGAEGVRGYAGPAGMRVLPDVMKFGEQLVQGEFDDAFRKAAINLVGDLSGLPAAQINRTITGAQALTDGDTTNPAALIFGFQRK